MFYQNVSELFELNVRRYPWKTAVIFGEQRVTYRELNNRINRTAATLLSLGVTQGEHVAFALPNSIFLVQIYYAIQKIGAVAVPLDPGLTGEEIASLLDDSNAKVLFFAAESLEKAYTVQSISQKVLHLIPLEQAKGFARSLVELMSVATEDEPPIFRRAQALSRIQFTGGSTGISRGVMRTHEADLAEIVAEMIYCKVGANADEVVLIQCPLGHHGGHSWYTSTLSSGCTLVICDTFSPREILSQIQRERVTYMLLLPPSIYGRLCESPYMQEYDVSSVTLIQSAAGSMQPEVILRISDNFPNAEIFYGWGQTESGLGTSITLTREMVEQNLPQCRSIGRAMPFFEMRVIDENGDLLPIGEIGELAVKSPAVMSGYYNRPELSAQVFTKDGWLRTGDIMYMDSEGYAYMLSRKKDVIKSGGKNVFAQEVEDVIKEHPAVDQCAVIGVADPEFDEAVCAVVKLKAGHTLTLDGLQAHCKTRLASYKKPRYLEIVDDFHMNNAGKIRKSSLLNKNRPINSFLKKEKE